MIMDTELVKNYLALYLLYRCRNIAGQAILRTVSQPAQRLLVSVICSMVYLQGEYRPHILICYYIFLHLVIISIVMTPRLLESTQGVTSLQISARLSTLTLANKRVDRD